MRHWYLSLCMGGVWSAGWSEITTSRPDATHTEWQIPVSHRYSNFSWWWAHSCPKHVGKRKHTKQNCAPSWIYLQESCMTSHEKACRQPVSPPSIVSEKQVGGEEWCNTQTSLWDLQDKDTSWTDLPQTGILLNLFFFGDFSVIFRYSCTWIFSDFF